MFLLGLLAGIFICIIIIGILIKKALNSYWDKF